METAKASKTKWNRLELPLDRDFVDFTVPGPCSHADVIHQIAKQREWRVEVLPDQLTERRLIRGRTVFGSARTVLNQITANYEDLWWTLSAGVLRFETRDTRVELSLFDEKAGRLMQGARRSANGRILPKEYLRVARMLDEQGLKPIDWLEGQSRKALAEWNQRHPRVAIRTFSEAYKRPLFRRAVARMLSRCKTKLREAHSEA